MISLRMSYHGPNYKREFNTNEFYEKIIKKVSVKLNRPLDWGEQKHVIAVIKSLDPAMLERPYRDETIKNMVKSLVNEF